MNLVFLYHYLTGYHYNALCHLMENNSNISILVIKHNEDKNAPYQFKNQEKLSIINKNEFNSTTEIYDHVNKFEPQILYIHGWFDKDYIKIAKNFKYIPVVTGLDNPWKNNIRQWVGLLYYRVFLRRIFKYVWVSGHSQYEFARRLGVKQENIIFNQYTSSKNLFKSSFKNLEKKREHYPKKILFLGRIISYKQPLELANTFKNLENKGLTKDWKLEFVGNGPELEKIRKINSENILISPFVQPNELSKKMYTAGAFILPSKRENWGVTIHEATLAGLPIITTWSTFSRTSLVINNFNGLLFKGNSKKDLENTLIKFFNLSNKELITMSENSLKISNVISQEYWTANLLSLIKN